MVRLGLPLLPLPPGSEAASILTVGVPETLGFDALYAAVKDRATSSMPASRRWRRTTSKSRSWENWRTMSSMTASELITAIRLAREVEAEQEVGRRRPPDADTRAVARPEEQEQMREPDENVTPLALATARAAVKKD